MRRPGKWCPDTPLASGPDWAPGVSKPVENMTTSGTDPFTEGLIIASYIAPAIALEAGKYEEAHRDRRTLARRAYELAVGQF